MLVLGRSRLLLLLLLLLLLPHKAKSEDGCRDHEWQCGDVCTSDEQSCTCGTSKFGAKDGLWCCGTECTGGGCHRWREGSTEEERERDPLYFCVERLPTYCTTGIALQLNQSCNGTCNYFGDNRIRNIVGDRSYVAACEDTSKCVKEGEGGFRLGYGSLYRPTICTGDSSCEGELNWCRKEEREEEKCPGAINYSSFVRCRRRGNKKGVKKTKSIPGQCIGQSQWRDGEKNNCLDRSDEDPFKEATKATNQQKTINFASLESCELWWTGSGWPGLKCCKPGDTGGTEACPDAHPPTDTCVSMEFWCKEKPSFECPVLGPGIRTNDPILCSNNTFWRQQPCGTTDGEKNIRCLGENSGECVQKKYWGLEGVKDRWGVELSCRDGSDKYRPIKQPTEAEESAEKPDPYVPSRDEEQSSNDNSVEEEQTKTADKIDPTKEHGGEHSQPKVWKTRPLRVNDKNQFFATYANEDNTISKLLEEGAQLVEDPYTGLWMIEESDPFKVPSVTEYDWDKGPLSDVPKSSRREEWAHFFSGDDYAKDGKTNRMMAAITKEACEANNGFVCKVKGSL